MSKFHQFYVMKNKKIVIVVEKIHHWISWTQIMKILQCDNDREFKKVCLQLLKNYEIKMINDRSRTSRTQKLIEQTNKIVKTRIAAWKKAHESTQWTNSLKEIVNQMNSIYCYQDDFLQSRFQSKDHVQTSVDETSWCLHKWRRESKNWEWTKWSTVANENWSNRKRNKNWD